MADRIDLVWWYAKTKYLRSPTFWKELRDMPDEDKNEALVNLLKDNFLLEDLGITLQNINEQILEVEKEAHEMGIQPKELRIGTGDWPMRSLLVAKAHVVNAIVLMQSMERTAETYIVANNYGADK